MARTKRNGALPRRASPVAGQSGASNKENAPPSPPIPGPSRTSNIITIKAESSNRPRTPASRSISGLSERTNGTTVNLEFSRLRRPQTTARTAFWYVSKKDWEKWLKVARAGTSSSNKTRVIERLHAYDLAGRVMETDDGTSAPFPCNLWTQSRRSTGGCRVAVGRDVTSCAYCKFHKKPGCTAFANVGLRAGNDGTRASGMTLGTGSGVLASDSTNGALVSPSNSEVVPDTSNGEGVSVEDLQRAVRVLMKEVKTLKSQAAKGKEEMRAEARREVRLVMEEELMREGRLMFNVRGAVEPQLIASLKAELMKDYSSFREELEQELKSELVVSLKTSVGQYFDSEFKNDDTFREKLVDYLQDGLVEELQPKLAESLQDPLVESFTEWFLDDEHFQESLGEKLNFGLVEGLLDPLTKSFTNWFADDEDFRGVLEDALIPNVTPLVAEEVATTLVKDLNGDDTFYYKLKKNLRYDMVQRLTSDFAAQYARDWKKDREFLDGIKADLGDTVREDLRLIIRDNYLKDVQQALAKDVSEHMESRLRRFREKNGIAS